MTEPEKIDSYEQIIRNMGKRGNTEEPTPTKKAEIPRLPMIANNIPDHDATPREAAGLFRSHNY